MGKIPFASFGNTAHAMAFPFFPHPCVEKARDLASRGQLVEAGEVVRLLPTIASRGVNRTIGVKFEPGAFLNISHFWDTYKCPRWQGQPLLPGYALHLAEGGGFGDAFQFCRYLPLVRERVGTAPVVCFVRQSWIGLLEPLAAANDIELVPLTKANVALYSTPSEKRLPPGWAMETEYLPFIFGLHPAPVPYLSVPGDASCIVQGNAPRIGLCWTAGEGRGRPWAGGKGYAVPLSERRTIPAQDFVRLARELPAMLPGAALYSLSVDRGGCAESIPSAVDLAPFICDDWTKTAAALAQLDLLITADTGIAHLAGALHVPTVVILPSRPCWRWGGDHAARTTPWYPTLRLVRQPSAGDWRGALEQARTVALELHIKKGSA